QGSAERVHDRTVQGVELLGPIEPHQRGALLRLPLDEDERLGLARRVGVAHGTPSASAVRGAPHAPQKSYRAGRPVSPQAGQVRPTASWYARSCSYCGSRFSWKASTASCTSSDVEWIASQSRAWLMVCDQTRSRHQLSWVFVYRTVSGSLRRSFSASSATAPSS